MTRLSVATVAALLAYSASAVPKGQIRVAVYVGGGTDAGSAGNFSAAMQDFVNDGTIKSFANLDETGIQSQLVNSAFDVVLFPGGSAGEESAAIGPQGLQMVQKFVSNGGGYYGTCAGGYLAGVASCCAQEMTGYCGGQTGCVNSTNWLGIIDQGVAEPWDRGHGLVTMMYTDEAVDMFQLPASYKGANVSILYWQGPIQSRMWSNAGYDTHASFTTEIHSLHPEWTTGEMVGTPSCITSTFGQGRVLVSAPHPEATIPRIDDIIRGYTLWVAQAI